VAYTAERLEEAPLPVQILVADDSRTMRKILEMTFAGEDAEVVTVESGTAAIAAAQERGADVVFADASMSAPDGYAVAQAIKNDPALSSTAVIVLASQHTPYDADRGRRAGVDDHVSKPFDTQVVIDKVAQVLSRPRARALEGAPPAGAGAAAPPPMPPEPPAPPPPPPGAAGVRPGGATPGAAPRAPAAPAAPPAQPAARPAPPRPAAPSPARAAPAAAAAAAASATTSDGDLAARLTALGLTADQISGVLALSREVIERVVWEVVPDLAETVIREEIQRLTSD